MNFVPPSDPVLWTPAKEVDDLVIQVHPHVSSLRALLATTERGVSIAAPQVGIPLRFFLTTGMFLPSVVVNPVILSRSFEMAIAEEGCLTWSGKVRDVARPEWVRVSFLNFHGVEREETFRGLSARIFQHETDHLDGKCIFPRPEGGA